MKPGVYWYRGPIQTSWNADDPWGVTNGWIVVQIADVLGGLSGGTIGSEACIWEADLLRMERDGRFIEIQRPSES